MVYICSPLRGDYGQNIKNAVRYCEIAAGLGVLPLAPHTIFTQYLNDTIPVQRQRGLDLGLALLEKCDELWVMGQQISEGMRGEIKLARSRGMPIYHIHTPFHDDAYPISADGRPLLGEESCHHHAGASDRHVILRYDRLVPASRTPGNQLCVMLEPPRQYPNGVAMRVKPIAGADCLVYIQDVLGFALPDVARRVESAYQAGRAAAWNFADSEREEGMEP